MTYPKYRKQFEYEVLLVHRTLNIVTRKLLPILHLTAVHILDSFWGKVVLLVLEVYEHIYLLPKMNNKVFYFEIHFHHMLQNNRTIRSKSISGMEYLNYSALIKVVLVILDKVFLQLL